MHHKRTTGLTSAQFATLATALNNDLTWEKLHTRPRKLSLNTALKITLLYLTNPVPGARHDVYAYWFHQLERFLDESTLADKGCIGLGLLTSTKRKTSVKMVVAVRRNNGRVNQLRSVVGRVIAPVLTWRVLHTGSRRSLSSYGMVFSVVRSLIFFAASDPL